MKFRIFVRQNWKDAPKGGGLTPYIGRKRTVKYCTDEQAAQTACNEYNQSHDPGRFGLIAEFERA